MTRDERRKLFEKADTDDNGMIDFQEFISIMVAKADSISGSEALKEAFEIFDTDSSGKISAKELRTALMTLGKSVSEEEVSISHDSLMLTRFTRQLS